MHLLEDALYKPDPAYSYRRPLDFCTIAAREPLFQALAESAAFRRLRGVRFLGGIDYLMVPSPNGAAANTRYTRYQHSLGVGFLALQYAKLRQLPPVETRLAYAAALLHDIGHGPLSHSLEPVFEETFGVNHHQATELLIFGGCRLGKEIPIMLKRYGVDPDAVISLIKGSHDPFDGFFSGPINFDTIDGVMRSRRYLSKTPNPVSPLRILIAAIQRQNQADKEIVDQFWKYKNDVYNLVIRSKFGVLADYLCQAVAREHIDKLSSEDFYASEENLFKKIPRLREILMSKNLKKSMQLYFGEVSYKSRSFFIHDEADFFSRNDCSRYRQIKHDRLVEFE